MVVRSNNPWETTDKAELVSIGTHKLHMSTSGRARRANIDDDPVIIFFTGGCAAACTYMRLQRLLGEHSRVYFHDRAGYDLSERPPGVDDLTAQQAAEELSRLLAVIDVKPPYILAGHSFGGIPARAFANICAPGEVVGIILADTGTELMYQLWHGRIPDPAFEKVAAGVDFVELTDLIKESKLTDEEIKKIFEANERTAPVFEVEQYLGSAYELAKTRQLEKHALDPWPVSVIRCDMTHDWRLLYDEGVKRGQGTEEERRICLKAIEEWDTFDHDVRTLQLALSSCNRHVFFAGHGHDDIIRRPEKVVDEVRWVLERYKEIRGQVET